MLAVNTGPGLIDLLKADTNFTQPPRSIRAVTSLTHPVSHVVPKFPDNLIVHNRCHKSTNQKSSHKSVRKHEHEHPRPQSSRRPHLYDAAHDMNNTRPWPSLLINGSPNRENPCPKPAKIDAWVAGEKRRTLPFERYRNYVPSFGQRTRSGEARKRTSRWLNALQEKDILRGMQRHSDGIVDQELPGSCNDLTWMRGEPAFFLRELRDRSRTTSRLSPGTPYAGPVFHGSRQGVVLSEAGCSTMESESLDVMKNVFGEDWERRDFISAPVTTRVDLGRIKFMLRIRSGKWRKNIWKRRWRRNCVSWITRRNRTKVRKLGSRFTIKIKFNPVFCPLLCFNNALFLEFENLI